MCDSLAAGADSRITHIYIAVPGLGFDQRLEDLMDITSRIFLTYFHVEYVSGSFHTRIFQAVILGYILSSNL